MTTKRRKTPFKTARSGNPAKRQRQARAEVASRMWPFAYTWFDEQDRLTLHSQVPLERRGGDTVLVIPGHGEVDVTEFVSPGSEPQTAIVAIVTNDDGSRHIMWQAGDTDQAVDELLTDLTILFMGEMPAEQAEAQLAYMVTMNPRLNDVAFQRDILNEILRLTVEVDDNLERA